MVDILFALSTLSTGDALDTAPRKPQAQRHQVGPWSLSAASARREAEAAGQGVGAVGKVAAVGVGVVEDGAGMGQESPRLLPIPAGAAIGERLGER